MRTSFRPASAYEPVVRRSLGGLIFLIALVGGAGCAADPPEIDAVAADLLPEWRVSYDGEDGRTVLELLRENADSVTTTGEGDEQLVTAINGIEGGVRGRYWLYYVNGEPGVIAASRMTTVDGDAVEWLFVR